MKSKKTLNPDLHFRLLQHLEDNPNLTQRELANIMEISLGSINYCLKALVNIGHLKMNNFQKNPNKVQYLYILTPKGISEKSTLAIAFLKRKTKEYQRLKEEIELVKLKQNIDESMVNKIGK
jgi:EPS-associated MarR family transcriptional regulator